MRVERTAPLRRRNPSLRFVDRRLARRAAAWSASRDKRDSVRCLHDRARASCRLI